MRKNKLNILLHFLFFFTTMIYSDDFVPTRSPQISFMEAGRLLEEFLEGSHQDMQTINNEFVIGAEFIRNQEAEFWVFITVVAGDNYKFYMIHADKGVREIPGNEYRAIQNLNP